MTNCKKLMLILLPCALIVGIFGVRFLRRAVATTYTKSRPKVLAEGEPRLKVQLGHSAEVRAVAFSHDGNFVLTGSEDRTAILWEVASGKEIRRFVGHKAGINAVAFSPDNRFILTGSGQIQLHTDVTSEAQSPDATARLWDLNTGKEILLIQADSGAITSVTFSPDGSHLLAGAFTFHEEIVENVAYVWDAKTGKKIREFKHHLGWEAGSRSYVSFSPDGELALIGFEEDTKHIGPQLWDIAAGKKVRQFSGAEFAAFSHDGHRIFLSNGSILNSLTGELIKRPPVSQLAMCVFSSEGQFMTCRKRSREDTIPATDWGDRNVAVWDVNKGQQILSIFEPSRKDRSIFEPPRKDIWVPTSAAVFSSDGNLILIGGDKGGAYLYDIESKEKKNNFQGQSISLIGNFSPTGHFITTENSLWDTVKGKQIKLVPQNEKAILCPDGRQLLLYRKLVFKEQIGAYEVDRERWEGALFDLQTEKKTRYYLGQNESLAFRPLFSPNCQTVVTGALDSQVEKISLISVSTGKLVREIVLGGPNSTPIPYNVAFSPDGRYIFAPIFPELKNGSYVPIFPELSEDGNDGDLGSAGGLFSVESGELIRRFKVPSEWPDIAAVSFSPDGRFVILGNNLGQNSRPTQKIIMFDVSTGKQVNKFEGHSEGITAIAFSPDGRFVLTAGEDRFVILWDAATAKMIRKFESDLSNGLSASFSPDGRFILTGSHDGAMAIWDFTSGKELCRLITFTNDDWFVITPDGRFDTNNLEDIKGLHWIMSNDPLKPLPLEIFMRQYYEPRLLARLLAGEKLKPLPSLSELNRTQPEVKILDIKPDSAETVEVTVEAANVKSSTQKDVLGNPLESGVYDVRLFRNGQLVGYMPTNDSKMDPSSFWSWFTSEPTNDGSMILNADGKATLKFSHIKWPRTGIEQVEFSAYAFNSDRIKSATDRKTYTLMPKPTPIEGRAYLIRLGVNAYEREGLNLRYAANDARRMDDLATRLAGQGEYTEVVSVSLISDYAVALADGRSITAQDATIQQVREGRKHITENTATKAHLHAVLDVLAGRQANAALLKDIPNVDKLRPARPEDLVLLSASSHGYTDSEGIFYLVPSDSGPALPSSPEFRSRCVSSDELSRWLRDVDAGDLVMIVDACHSAAIVEGTDFKPGPMGSRGLGQLSYDKGMRILTATQVDNVALETNQIRQGLLMYALLQDGLASWLADYKPKDKSIMLTEWLSYCVERVPHLYEEMRDGRIRGTFDPRELENNKTQQPSLFDFARKQRREVIVARQP